MDELAKVQTESGIIWVLAASVQRVLELAQKGREGKEAKHNGKSGERTKQARLLFVHGARCCASARHGLSGVFQDAGLHLFHVAKKQKGVKVESF